ncbi:MAG TPA: hypothetical protein VJ725_18045 [Thermoanaerobaculia bacterium]|nr:hypothetical protein [Thermoanaerobaculia bacterium]
MAKEIGNEVFVLAWIRLKKMTAIGVGERTLIGRGELLDFFA